jgi:hypothetical protein
LVLVVLEELALTKALSALTQYFQLLLLTAVVVVVLFS